MTRWNLRECGDDELISGLDRLVARERQVTADVLAHLAEVDARKLYAHRAYASLFQYVVENLGYSEGAARRRITAARLARRFPLILERLAIGAIHLSGLTLLGPHLTEANHVEWLDEARGKSKRRLEELVAARLPRPDVLPMIVPVTSAAEPAADPDSAAREPASPQSRPVSGTAPLSAESFSVTFTIDRQTRDTLAEAQDLLRHAVPDGDLGAIVGRALDGLVKGLRKRKFGETDTPREGTKASPGSRRFPAAVKREVAERDDRSCSFVSDDGRRCGATAWLEYDHRDPRGRGGPSTADNARLLCATHNALHAERTYGREHIEARKREHRARPRAVPADLVDLAQKAIRDLGFNEPIARRAVRRAAADLDANASIEVLLRTSLQHTPLPVR
jgi:5-methylcytosine-specific restriction endonuclease McrA